MLYLVVIAIQVACIGHAMKTGQDRQWLWVLLLLPVAGAAAYLIIVVLPDLLGARGIRHLQADFRRTVNPEGPTRAAEKALATAQTPENWHALARAQADQRRWDDALASLAQAMTGPHALEPDLLHGKAYILVEKGDAAGALRVIRELREVDPQFRRDQVGVLAARAFEAAGHWDEAQSELETVLPHFAGEEVRARLAMLLQRRGAEAEAVRLAGELLERVGRASAGYRADQRRWIEEAKRIAGREVFG